SSSFAIGSAEELLMTEECRMQNAECRQRRSRGPFCILHSAFCILFAVTVAAQTTTPYTPTPPIPPGDTYLSLPSSPIAGHGSWEVKFTHRFNQSLAPG